ncbi:hypothetical protein DFJ77DRAFT_203454 [Powellomyces hirtus]|nr:hypothetical protein DFJ77DRAFT_203454 [Powellomyces hirtus]
MTRSIKTILFVITTTTLLVSGAPTTSDEPVQPKRRPPPASLLMRDEQILVNGCAPPSDVEFVDTWMETNIGREADTVLRNAAQVYNQWVLPVVHDCVGLSGDAAVALSEFYEDYYHAAHAVVAKPTNMASPFEQNALRNQVCLALESVQSAVVKITKPHQSNQSDSVCQDEPPVSTTPTQVANRKCNLFAEYQAQNRPYLLPATDAFAGHPLLAHLADGLGCRKQVVGRMKDTEAGLLETLERREKRSGTK